jgi:hypothetical protein
MHLTVLAAPHRTSYTVPHCATLYPTVLRCTPLSYAVPYRATPTHWATLHPVGYAAPCELRCTLWATLHPTELFCIPLSYAVPHQATPYPTELPKTLSATLHPTELRCTPLSYAVPYIVNIHDMQVYVPNQWQMLASLPQKNSIMTLSLYVRICLHQLQN